jgi:hypothetical protein
MALSVKSCFVFGGWRQLAKSQRVILPPPEKPN